MDVKKKKILFIIPSLAGGGSERVMLHLVNNLDRNKFDINLLIISKKGELFDSLRDDINVTFLGARKIRYSVFKIISHINKLRPDLVFSTLGHLNLMISMIKPFMPKSIKFAVRESSILSKSYQMDKYTKIFSFVAKRFYNNFDMVVAQSAYMKDDMINNFGINSSIITVINNPVDFDMINKLSETEQVLFDKSKFNLLAIGRLGAVKRFHLLVELMSAMDRDYHLTILGDGSERERLSELAESLGAEDRISFKGFQPNPYQFMAQADLLLLSSKYEGLPNVLLEANACGTPVFALECPGVNEDIVKNNVTGLLIKNDSLTELKEKITMLRNNEIQLSKDTIINETFTRYNLKHIITQYENLLI